MGARIARLSRQPLVPVKILAEYLDRSSIHGVFYIGQPNRPYLERLMWIIAVLVSFSFSSFYIGKTFYRWQNNPVMVTMDERPTFVYDVSDRRSARVFADIVRPFVVQVPFPAMTICPQNKYRKSIVDVDSIIQHLRSMTEPNMLPTLWRQISNTLPLVCSLDFELNASADQFLDVVDFDVQTVLKNAAPSAEETIQSCFLMNQNQQSCQPLFREVFTLDGLCYTFNGLMPNHLYQKHT